MPRDDVSLLRRTHAGHEASARELWQRHAGWMLAYARGVLGAGGATAAEDVVQSVFCRVLEADRRTIRAVREARPWLAQLVRRQSLNHIRGARRSRSRERWAQRETSPEPVRSGMDLGEAMTRLPRRYREVLHLRHVAGLSTDQAALALGIPRGTVASRHAAAVRALRELLSTDRGSGLVSGGRKTEGARHAHAI